MICNSNKLINKISKTVFSTSNYQLQACNNWVREQANHSKENSHTALAKIFRKININTKVKARIRHKDWVNKFWIVNNIAEEIKGSWPGIEIIFQIKKLIHLILAMQIKILLEIIFRLNLEDFLSRQGKYKTSFQKAIFK